MTLIDVYTRLGTLNIPLAYLAFKSAQSPPYIVYRESGARLHGSDDKNYIKDMTVVIELYAAKKDAATEESIEALFSDVELSKSEDIWIEGEQIVMVAYTFTTINK